MVERRSAERSRRYVAVSGAGAGEPYVCSVVRANSRRNVRVCEKTLAQRQNFVCACAHENDIDQPLRDDFADLSSVFVERFELCL